MGMSKLNPTDLGFLLFESRQTPQHVANLSIYSLPKDADPRSFVRELIDSYRHVKQVYPPFNQVLTYPPLKAGMPSWRTDQEFDLDYHLRHSALPAPGGMKELTILVSRLHSTLLDRARPMWELHVIEGLEGNRFAVYSKMHHALIDGVGGMRLLQSVLSPDPDKDKPPFFAVAPARRRKVQGPDHRAPQISDMIRTMLASAGKQARSLTEVTKAYAQVAREAMKKEKALAIPYTAPQSILNVPITGQRRFTVVSFQMERIRALGKRLGGTINDVIMAMCSGALRTYLLDQDALPARSLIADVPVSVRPADGAASGNAISFILADLGTHLESPLDRYNHVKSSMAAGKSLLQSMSREAINNYTMVGMLPFTLAQAAGLTPKRPRMFNIVISNVPGPRQHLYMHGAHLDELYAVSLLFHGQALNITITSYVDTLDIALIGCRDALPGIGHLGEFIERELESLERIAGK